MHLEIKNLVKFYKKELPIIKKLNFSINKGNIISFIGESGSGKTTLLKCISGLEKINSGSILLNGEVLNNKNIFIKPQERKIGFIFQDYPLFPHLNLKKNILFNLDENFRNNIDYMLSLTNLEKLTHRYPHELSGGEQQRACIARALIREPELLLMDEPFSNLDSQIKESIKEEIYKIIRKTNTTTILVTHDIKDCLNISDKILVFKAGVLQQYDDPKKMYCEPANCYCAKILGDLNKIVVKNKNHYLRPESLKIVKKSDFEVEIDKCFFQGKDYKIRCFYRDEIWYFNSIDPYNKSEKVYLNFNKKDLMFFDSLCEDYFNN